MRISDWSSDVCSSDLAHSGDRHRDQEHQRQQHRQQQQAFVAEHVEQLAERQVVLGQGFDDRGELLAERRRILRSEEHTSELQSLMRISYAVFCLKKKKTRTTHN